MRDSNERMDTGRGHNGFGESFVREGGAVNELADHKKTDSEELGDAVNGLVTHEKTDSDWIGSAVNGLADHEKTDSEELGGAVNGLADHEKTDGEKTLIEHLEELRMTLIKCFLSVAVVLPVAFYFAPKLLEFLIKLFLGDRELYYFAPMEVFLIQIKLAFLISLAVCFPYIAKCLWDYLVPALYEHEKKFIRIIVLLSSSLFLSGVVFCLLVILPLIMGFALNFANNSITAMLGISNVVNLALNLAFVFGLMFQIPLITYLLIRWGIVSYETISSKRRYVVVMLLVFSALLTPPDIISQIMLFLPTYSLFELGLLFSRKSVESRE